MGVSFKENKQNFNDLKLETIGEHCFAGVCFVPRSFAFFIKLGVFLRHNTGSRSVLRATFVNDNRKQQRRE